MPGPLIRDPFTSPVVPQWVRDTRAWIDQPTPPDWATTPVDSPGVELLKQALKTGTRLTGVTDPAAQASAVATTSMPGAPPAPPPGIRARHVSPHDFDRFDISKVGSGQGATSFGHGLYFAENPAVTDDYVRYFNLGRDRPVEGGGHLPEWVVHTLMGGAQRQKYENLLADFRERLASAEAHVASEGPQWWVSQERIPFLRQTLLGLENAQRGGRIKSAARTYDVNLRVAPEQLLDWDTTIGQQSPAVQEIGKLAGGVPRSGEGLYRHIESQQREPSSFFRERGVPGLRYLDQGSRDLPADPFDRRALERKLAGMQETLAARRAGAPVGTLDNWRLTPVLEREAAELAQTLARQPTRNIVMFDDSLIDILRKYGLLPAAVTTGALARTAAQPMASHDQAPQVGAPPPAPMRSH